MKFFDTLRIYTPNNQTLVSCSVLFLVTLIALCESSSLRAQDRLEPGVDRWAIKTSLPQRAAKKNIQLSELLALPNPIDHEEAVYDSTRILTPVGPHSLKEGEIVTTHGWLHLVALEDDRKTHRDGDYHMQIRTSEQWGDSCLVVEIPYGRFVPDERLARACDSLRQFVKDHVLGGKEPGTRGNKLSHAVYVKITGQLFFDAPHLSGNPRGKLNMKSYTPWELHPVTSIEFARNPD